MISSLMLIAALLSSPLHGEAHLSPTNEICEGIHVLIGGDLVEWHGYPQGWDLPVDLKKVARVDFDSGGLWEYYSRSEHARYIWVFTSYDQTTDSRGKNLGAHDFCGPYKVSDG